MTHKTLTCANRECKFYLKDLEKEKAYEEEDFNDMGDVYKIEYCKACGQIAHRWNLEEECES